MPNLRLAILVCLYYGLALSDGRAAEQFKAEGLATYVVFGPTNSAPLISLTNQFRIIVKDCLWYVAVRLVGTSDIGGKDAILSEWSYDGTMFGRREEFKSPPAERQKELDKLLQKYNSYKEPALVNLDLYPGNCPFTDLTLAAPVWLCYGSRCYLAALKDNKCAPCYSQEFQLVTDLDYRVLVTKRSASGWLLEMTFANDGLMYKLGPSGDLARKPDKSLVLERMSPPFDVGYPEASFRAMGQHGDNPPEGWELLYYRADVDLRDPTKLKNDVVGSIQGTTTNYSLLKAEIPDIFQIQRLTHVTDYRAYPGRKLGVSYITKDRILPMDDKSYAEAVQAGALKRFQLEAQAQSWSPSSKRWIWAVVSIAIAISCLLLRKFSK